MAITSMLFLFLFLPLSLAIYYIADDKAKEYVLLAVSLVFYALGSLRYIALFLISMIITCVIGRTLSKQDDHRIKKLLLIVGVLCNLGLLIYYKYTDFAIRTYNSLFGSEIGLKNLLLPMGISFFTFKAISYLVDIYKGRAVLDANPVHDALYLSFFGQIQSGPLTRYQDMKKEDGLFSDGVYRFVIGFNKKVLIANVLANITNEVFSNSFDNFSTSYAWLGAICYSLQLFFDFAGYSDMAIGISEMFGYKCMENFNFPYMTESVSRFWRRWHISLSQWFRDYIYIPMGGSRQRSQCRVYFNLLVVWALTGIWHGASWNFVVWGLGYFVLIAFEHATGFPEKFKPRFLKLIYRIFSLFFINFEWVLFRADDLATGLRFIKKMFICAANPLADVRTMFLIKDYLFFIVIAIILCFPVVSWMDNKLKNKKTAHAVYGAVIQILAIAAFIWAISFVVSGQNNPFAYANF